MNSMYSLFLIFSKSFLDMAGRPSPIDTRDGCCTAVSFSCVDGTSCNWSVGVWCCNRGGVPSGCWAKLVNCWTWALSSSSGDGSVPSPVPAR